MPIAKRKRAVRRKRVVRKKPTEEKKEVEQKTLDNVDITMPKNFGLKDQPEKVLAQIDGKERLIEKVNIPANYILTMNKEGKQIWRLPDPPVAPFTLVVSANDRNPDHMDVTINYNLFDFESKKTILVEKAKFTKKWIKGILEREIELLGMV